MAGRNPHQAITAFVEPIQKALSRFGRTPVRATHPTSGRPGFLVIGRDEPIVLPGGHYLLEIRQQFVTPQVDGALGPYKVSTTAYQYSILQREEETELYAYHWHPDSKHKVPHFHMPVSMPKHHFPSGRIAIEQVLLFAATELGCVPSNPDWIDILNDALGKFHRYRTWSAAGPGKIV